MIEIGLKPNYTDGGLDVIQQNGTTRAIINKLCKVDGSSFTLTASTIPGEYDIVLSSVVGLSIGDEIGLFQDSTNPASFFAKITAISSLTITVDTPLDIVFDIINNSPILFKVICNLNVDGSSTPEIFSIVNGSSIEIDITRVIIKIADGLAMDDGKFGGIPALSKGVVLRKKNNDGTFTNYFNVKTNGDIGALCYDATYTDKAPAGENGFGARLTFAGQNKIGVAIRLGEDEELQMIVQDDLTTLTSFIITAEGHFTD